MKKTILSAAIIAACLPALHADGFSLAGNIPGLPKGAKISIVSQEQGGRRNIGETVTDTDDGAFSIEGSVDSPTLAELRIDTGRENDLNKTVSFMAENGPMSISAAHLDSLPPSFYAGTDGKLKELNVTITGGEAQKEYQEFQKAMFPFELEYKKAHYDLFWADDRRGRSEAEEKQLRKIFDNAGIREDSARRSFIKLNPSYSISGLMLMQDISSPFFFTAQELDSVQEMMQVQKDTRRLERVNKALLNSRRFLRESPYTDFAVVDTLNSELNISDYTKDGKYVMIDFWASWCGPCRTAIPHVRELHNRYGDKLRVISISVDSEEKEWRKAMKEENMEWTQLWAGQDRTKSLVDNYGLSGIPYLLILSPDGRILYAGHSTPAVSECLAKEIK